MGREVSPFRSFLVASSYHYNHASTDIIILSDTKAALFLFYTRTELIVFTSCRRITIQRTSLNRTQRIDILDVVSSSLTLLIIFISLHKRAWRTSNL